MGKNDAHYHRLTELLRLYTDSPITRAHTGGHPLVSAVVGEAVIGAVTDFEKDYFFTRAKSRLVASRIWDTAVSVGTRRPFLESYLLLRKKSKGCPCATTFPKVLEAVTGLGGHGDMEYLKDFQGVRKALMDLGYRQSGGGAAITHDSKRWDWPSQVTFINLNAPHRIHSLRIWVQGEVLVMAPLPSWMSEGVPGVRSDNLKAVLRELMNHKEVTDFLAALEIP